MIIDDLRANKNIVERKYGDISSFNFSAGAFFNKIWDEQTVKARGLYINTKTGEVVARSYDKFFNIGERPETQMDALKNTIEFPVQAYEKENGFLGIMSYNKETKDFIITSKSAMESEYAGWFKDIFYSTTNAKTREGIKFFLEQHNVSAVFEVLDPVHNPHIIDQPKQKLVVLDLVRNTIETEIMPYRVTQLFCFTFGLPCKKLRKTLNIWKEFEDFVNETHNSIRQVEGYVLVDSNGYMLKVKTNYYRTWKYLRTISERVRTGKDIKEQALSSQIMKDFCEWCRNNVEVLGEDITKLRLRFYGDMGEAYDGIY